MLCKHTAENEEKHALLGAGARGVESAHDGGRWLSSHEHGGEQRVDL